MNEKRIGVLPIREQPRASSPLENTTTAPPSTNPVSAGKRISSAAVREFCGDISDMTLWRRLNDPEMGFPKPSYVQRRRYWREADVIARLDAQAATVAA